MKNKLYRQTIRKITALGAIALVGIGATACGDAQAASGAALQAEAKETTGNNTGGADISDDTTNTVSSTDTAGEGVTKITVAHTQAYKPYDFINENEESDGYEVAVLKAVDELLPQYEFEYVGTTDDDLLIGVESGKYDVGTKGVWWTSEREKKFVFPKHYIGSSIIGIVIRSEDADQITDLESFAEYSGSLVPIGAQNAQYTIVDNYNKTHPDKQIDLIAGDQFEVADAYQWVLEGRYDAYINIKTSFEASVEAEDGEYHDYLDRLSYITYEGIPTWPLFNINNQALADAYDEAWEQLKADGTLEKLQQEYFGYSLFDYVPEGYQIGDDL
ncbi:MAG: transporter substrate-binding domain-containing protein [Lachnospiraceae bacterium]|nr:transporter substrate-binding domain-containing protein [Lachnospiraceae bacterium]